MRVTPRKYSKEFSPEVKSDIRRMHLAGATGREIMAKHMPNAAYNTFVSKVKRQTGIKLNKGKR